MAYPTNVSAAQQIGGQRSRSFDRSQKRASQRRTTHAVSVWTMRNSSVRTAPVANGPKIRIAATAQKIPCSHQRSSRARSISARLGRPLEKTVNKRSQRGSLRQNNERTQNEQEQDNRTDPPFLPNLQEFPELFDDRKLVHGCNWLLMASNNLRAMIWLPSALRWTGSPSK